jgi:hypothetical protein
MPNHELQDGTAKAEAAPPSAEEQEWMKKAIACLPEHQQKPFAAVQQDVNLPAAGERCATARARAQAKQFA